MASRAITISPSDVSRVAVYRFDGSMPISGGDLKSCFLGADPSNGGNSEAMGPDVNAQSGQDPLALVLSSPVTGPDAPSHIWARIVANGHLGAEPSQSCDGVAPRSGRS